MSHPSPTHADRVARSLKRLGLRMTRVGRRERNARRVDAGDAGEPAAERQPREEAEGLDGSTVRPSRGAQGGA